MPSRFGRSCNHNGLTPGERSSYVETKHHVFKVGDRVRLTDEGFYTAGTFRTRAEAAAAVGILTVAYTESIPMNDGPDDQMITLAELQDVFLTQDCLVPAEQ
jgi:hypothetical protein